MYVSSPDLWPEHRDQISICFFHVSTGYLTADSKGTCQKFSSWPHPTCPIAVLAVWVNVSFILPFAQAQNLSTIPDSSLSLTPRPHPIRHQSFWYHLQNSYRIDTLLTPSLISHLDYYSSLLSGLLASIFFLNNLFSKPAAKVKTIKVKNQITSLPCLNPSNGSRLTRSESHAHPGHRPCSSRSLQLPDLSSPLSSGWNALSSRPRMAHFLCFKSLLKCHLSREAFPEHY